MNEEPEDLPTLAAGRWTDAHAPAAPVPPSPAAPGPPTSEPPPPAPEPSHAARGWIVGLAALVALLVGGAAFVSTQSVLDARDDNNAAAAAPSPNGSGGSPSTRPIPVQPVDPDAAVLGGLIVQQADVPVGYVVQLLQNGTDAVSQPTLDLCNGTYPSESERRARRQVVVLNLDGTNDRGLSTEAVLYKNPNGAVRAFADLKSVVAKCPNRPVISPVGDEPVTTHFNAQPDKKWRNVPTVDRLAYDLTTTNDAGDRVQTIAVYLKRGRALIGLYFPSTGKQVAVQGKTAIPDIVNIFAERLAKLPPRVVNGPPA